MILDTSILIESERRKEGVEDVLRRVRSVYGEIPIGLSAMSAVELTHGVYRAKTDADRQRRMTFVRGALRELVIYPVSLEIAILAGRIDGEQAAKGISIATEDLVIGVTALHLRYDIVTLNVKHFQQTPGLKVHTI